MLVPDQLVDVEHTSTSSDCLASTELDQPSRNGTLLIWAASTVNTATLEVPQAGHNPGVTNLLPKASDGIPLVDRVIPYKVQVTAGKRPMVVLGGTTGTVHITAAFYFA